VASDLSGRSDQRMVALIARQIDTAAKGARLAESMAAGEVSAADARTRMVDIEHLGDDQRAELVRELGHSLTTPIDREDLFRLSRSVDDVLDDLRDFARESDLYGMGDQPGVAPLLAAIAEGLEELKRAVGNVVASPATVPQDAQQAKKHCNRVRQLYQLQLAELFQGEVDVEMFKRRELLRRIDVVALRMGEAADALQDGVLKRRH
jgi:uncharacterized protein Yka (UPF0111/DUF47 family)